jgi:hypothetical protein
MTHWVFAVSNRNWLFLCVDVSSVLSLKKKPFLARDTLFLFILAPRIWKWLPIDRKSLQTWLRSMTCSLPIKVFAQSFHWSFEMSVPWKFCFQNWHGGTIILPPLHKISIINNHAIFRIIFVVPRIFPSSLTSECASCYWPYIYRKSIFILRVYIFLKERFFLCDFTRRTALDIYLWLVEILKWDN